MHSLVWVAAALLFCSRDSCVRAATTTTEPTTPEGQTIVTRFVNASFSRDVDPRSVQARVFQNNLEVALAAANRGTRIIDSVLREGPGDSVEVELTVQGDLNSEACFRPFQLFLCTSRTPPVIQPASGSTATETAFLYTAGGLLVAGIVVALSCSLYAAVQWRPQIDFEFSDLEKDKLEDVAARNAEGNLSPKPATPRSEIPLPAIPEQAGRESTHKRATFRARTTLNDLINSGDSGISSMSAATLRKETLRHPHEINLASAGVPSRPTGEQWKQARRAHQFATLAAESVDSGHYDYASSDFMPPTAKPTCRRKPVKTEQYVQTGPRAGYKEPEYDYATGFAPPPVAKPTRRHKPPNGLPGQKKTLRVRSSMSRTFIGSSRGESEADEPAYDRLARSNTAAVPATSSPTMRRESISELRAQGYSAVGYEPMTLRRPSNYDEHASPGTHGLEHIDSDLDDLGPDMKVGPWIPLHPTLRAAPAVDQSAHFMPPSKQALARTLHALRSARAPPSLDDSDSIEEVEYSEIDDIPSEFSYTFESTG